MEKTTSPSLEALRALVDLCGDGACLVDPDDGRVVYANPSLLRRLQPSYAPPSDRAIVQLIPEWKSPSVRTQLAELLAGERDEIAFQGSLEFDEIAEIHVRRVASAEGLLLAIVMKASAAATNIAAADRRKGTDPLTGLADRACLLDMLTAMVRGDRLSDQRCVVLFIDVDGFKQVNDSYGHLVGDRVLQEVARRLAASVRAGDYVARFGGDEFVVLLERVHGLKTIEPVVRRIEAAFRRPIPLPQGDVTLTVSVGAAQAGVDGGTAEELIDAADRAMYAAKRATA